MQTEPVGQGGDAVRYGRADDVVLRAIAGENFLIVLHAGESKMFCLNRMGLWFWNQLETSKNRAELLAAMLDRFEVDEPVASREVDRFLGDLVAKRLAVTSAS